MSFQSADRVQTPEGRQYHLDASPGDVAQHILLVGDPDRAEQVATRFSSIRFRSSHREYRIITGEHRSLDLSVICVGMGAGSDAAGPLPMDPGLLGPHQTVVDLVYMPLKTPLLRAAAARGANPVDGLGIQPLTA